jgi:hypothetical protein
MVRGVSYWLTSLEREEETNAFNAQIQHGDRLLSYRYTVRPVRDFYVLNTDRRTRVDFPGPDGLTALLNLRGWLVRAYRGAALTLPMDLNEAPPLISESDEQLPPPTGPDAAA